jgi:hypothetical protein
MTSLEPTPVLALELILLLTDRKTSLGLRLVL